jgi:D-xylose transport system ATP-binding protein
MENITKAFPGVKALDDVTLRVKRGEIHALVGENGAGKSTLMKILSGVYPANEHTGELIVNGERKEFKTIRESEAAGIVIVHQELNIFGNLSIVENVFFGNESVRYGVINKYEQQIKTEELLKKVSLEDSLDTPVNDMGTGKQQLLEIARAINKNASILVFDEPSASLTEDATDNLLEVLRRLKENGMTCIYISHKLSEVFRTADSVTILRDGKTVVTKPISELDEEKMIAYMVGRDLTEKYPRVEHTATDTVLEVSNWSVPKPYSDRMLLDNINIYARKGEIVGIAGLMGAGRTELAMSIFGVLKNSAGVLKLNDKQIVINNPDQAISAGISYVSEDRKRYGLVLGQNIKQNISLPSLRRISAKGVIDANREIIQAEQGVKDFNIITPSIEQLTRNLSGGNQQKVILSKWLLTNPKVLILDEPTRGIDVGAKYEIYQIMNKLVDQGVCIIVISSELPEVLGICDRIYVISAGKITGEYDYREATQEKLLVSMALGSRPVGKA